MVGDVGSSNPIHVQILETRTPRRCPDSPSRKAEDHGKNAGSIRHINHAFHILGVTTSSSYTPCVENQVGVVWNGKGWALEFLFSLLQWYGTHHLCLGGDYQTHYGGKKVDIWICVWCITVKRKLESIRCSLPSGTNVFLIIQYGILPVFISEYYIFLKRIKNFILVFLSLDCIFRIDTCANLD